MALNTGKILMRRGQEVNFDPDKMSPGEWAVSLDARYVRMCFAPGICVRMATYEAFEEDMKQIEAILLECHTIEEAVQRINTEINTKIEAVVEYVGQAKTYRDEAKTFRDEAETFKNQAGESVVDNLLSTSTTLPLSANQGRVLDEKIGTINESLGVDIKLIDGVPHWSARGADSFSPFNRGGITIDDNSQLTFGSVKTSASSVTTINLGFRPKLIVFELNYYNNSSAPMRVFLDCNTKTWARYYKPEDGTGAIGIKSRYFAEDGTPIEITDTGIAFKVYATTYAQDTTYYAIG